MFLVFSGEKKRYGAPADKFVKLGDGCRIFLKLSEVARAERFPSGRIMAEPFSQGLAGRDFFEPEIDTPGDFRNAPWPKPIYEHTKTIGWFRRIIHTLEFDHIAVDTRAYVSLLSAILPRVNGGRKMKRSYLVVFVIAILSALFFSTAGSQEKKLDKIRVGGGSASATQMSMWLAKEGNYYEKNGLNVEAISIPGSSLALQAMLAGDLPIIQLGGAASIQANFSGADTVIVATIVRKFLFWIFATPGIERMEALKGKVFGTTRFGTLSDLAARFALRAHGIDPERDITMVQTGGPAEAIAAMAGGKIQAAALSPPATLRARKLKFNEILDMSKLENEYHINGVVTTRRFLRSNEDTVRRFLKAYIEGAARGKRDEKFALKVMGKYFRTDDREILEESYNTTIKSNFSLPPYPSIPGIASLLQGLEKQNPKAKGAKPEDFADSRLVRDLDQSGFVKAALQ
jgi:NitT/TauT family transport system substrate-binding protein